MKRLIPLLFVVLPVFAGAACPAVIPSDRVCVRWTPPTTNTDATPVSTPLRFRVYRQTGATWTSIIEVTASDVTLAGQPKGRQCFAVVAIDSGAHESAMSDSACKTLRLPAPTDGSIEAPSDGSIEFPK